MSGSQLTISDLRVWVHLGCSEQEKHHPQPVSIDIQVNFKQHPEAIYTDSLEDAFCYLKASELIQAALKERQFNLIEYLAAFVHDTIYQAMIEGSQLRMDLVVTVKKLSPPVPGVHGGVSFVYAGKQA